MQMLHPWKLQSPPATSVTGTRGSAAATAVHFEGAMTKLDPLISIVIPYQKEVQEVGECLTSALEQTYPKTEILCVHNGSCGESLQRLLKLGAVHQGKVSLVTSVDGDIGSAMNRGLAAARGHYVQFLRASDRLCAWKIARQVALIGAAAAPPDIVVAGYAEKGPDGNKHVVALPEPYEPWSCLLHGQLGSTASNLWRAERLREVGGWCEDPHTDPTHELIFRLLRRGVSLLYDEACLTVRTRKKNASAVERPATWKQAGLTDGQLRSDVVQHLRTRVPPRLQWKLA